MTDVTVIGLGPMGGALARVLLERKYDLTVWNRTAARAEPYVGAGARLAESVLDAVRASPVTVVCVADYASSYALLGDSEQAALAGKTLVQLSTGSPRAAREHEAWARRANVGYLDGAILAVPSQMGSAESTILVSGAEASHAAAAALLRDLAGTVTYLGPAISAASTLDLAVLSHLYGALLGFYHGVRICEREGVPVESLGGLVHGIAPAIGEVVKHEADILRDGAFAMPQSSLENSARVLAMMVHEAEAAGLDASFPRYASSLFERAMAAGYGGEALASIVKVLRAA
jgi:3-hydroxyisobutyrate dehydrogenase-like beta-hydroxyacid dehydrogenase